LAEAMAAQVPVISTFVSAIPELIENETNGLLVPPYNDHALAEAIARLLDDPPLRQRLGKRGRQTVIEQFDAELNAQAIYEVFFSQGAYTRVNP
jgi:glycosyltransferase involved in cell wall biosynthesis